MYKMNGHVHATFNNTQVIKNIKNGKVPHSG